MKRVVISMAPWLALIFALISAASARAAAADAVAPPVTPYRPSVSTPAQLPAPGQLELELGGLSARSADGQRGSLPYTLKLAFSEEWGVLVGGEAFVTQPNDGGGRGRGLGDTQLVLKRAFPVDSETAFGLELGAKVPTAKDRIGSGKADYSLNTIYSKDYGQLHMDANLNATRMGAVDAGTGRVQAGWSASFSLPVAERWGATGELSGARRAGAGSSAQLLVAATYNPSKRLAIDFGAAKGLNRAAQDWSVFSGFVVPLARLW